MITIFTIPKPFNGHINIIQRNAIQSWLALRPNCEIILFGNEKGIAETANEFNLKHIPDIPCNQYGTPYLSKAFEIVKDQALNPVLCYVNADIILTSDVIRTTQLVSSKMKRFLLVGHRWNLDIDDSIDFSNDNWEDKIRHSALFSNQVSSQWGSDYFIYSKESLGKLEDFLIGRPVWDNWMFYHARQVRTPLIFANCAIIDIHQNHDYKHVPFGKQNSYEGPEAEYNKSLLPDKTLFTLFDATHVITEEFELIKASDNIYLQHRIKRYRLLHPSKAYSFLFHKIKLRLASFLYNKCSDQCKSGLWRKLVYYLTT